MITQITDVPNNMVAFRATGEVTEDDFDAVILSVKDLVNRTGKLNYLLVIDTELSHFTAGAWLQDALLGIKNLTKWNRASIVTDSDTIIGFTEVFSKVMPGEFRGFHKEDYKQAIGWTSEQTL